MRLRTVIIDERGTEQWIPGRTGRPVPEERRESRSRRIPRPDPSTAGFPNLPDREAGSKSQQEPGIEKGTENQRGKEKSCADDED
jgi:hypothetical protein